MLICDCALSRPVFPQFLDCSEWVRDSALPIRWISQAVVWDSQNRPNRITKMEDAVRRLTSSSSSSLSEASLDLLFCSSLRFLTSCHSYNVQVQCSVLSVSLLVLEVLVHLGTACKSWAHWGGHHFLISHYGIAYNVHVLRFLSYTF